MKISATGVSYRAQVAQLHADCAPPPVHASCTMDVGLPWPDVHLDGCYPRPPNPKPYLHFNFKVEFHVAFNLKLQSHTCLHTHHDA